MFLDNNSTDDRMAHAAADENVSIFATSLPYAKPPLIHGEGTVRPFASGPHFAAEAQLPDLTAVLRHYNFVGAFEQHTEEGVREGQHYRGSRTYRHYNDIFTADPNLRLCAPTVREYRSPEELLASGFLVASDRYLAWVRGLREDAGDR